MILYLRNKIKKNSKSIIELFPNKELKNTYEVKNWASDQILIHVPLEINQYALSTRYETMFTYSLYIPILIEAINLIRLEDEEDFSNLQWYIRIHEFIDKLDDPGADAYIVAQYLLESPFKNLIKEFDNLEDEEDTNE